MWGYENVTGHVEMWPRESVDTYIDHAERSGHATVHVGPGLSVEVRNEHGQTQALFTPLG